MNRSRISATLCALVLALEPAAVHAASSSSPAGFAPSLWVGASSIVDGDTVKIYTVVYDSLTEPIEGTVVFLVDGTSIGSQAFSLPAGGNAVLSAPWKATAGSHALSARIDGPVSRGTKQPVVLADTAASVNVKVAEAPPPSPIQKAAGTAADAVTVATPVVKDAVNVVVSKSEAIREAGEQYFADKVATIDAAPAGTIDVSTSTGAVLGTTTYRAPAKTGFLAGFYRIMHAIFASAALFYLAALLIVLFLFWVMKRRFGNANA